MTIINGIIVDDFIRINFPTAAMYYYGLKKGFTTQNDYKVLVLGLAPTVRTVQLDCCEIPSRLEELLYF